MGRPNFYERVGPEETMRKKVQKLNEINQELEEKQENSGNVKIKTDVIVVSCQMCVLNEFSFRISGTLFESPAEIIRNTGGCLN